MGQITGNKLTINGSTTGTNTLVSAVSGAVTLSDDSYIIEPGTPPAAKVMISNIQVANLSATSVDSSNFSGSVVSLAGAPAWQSVGPQNVTQGQVEGMAAQGNPVSGEVLAVAINPVNPKQVFIGTSNGGVWKTDDITATKQVSIAQYEDPLRDPAPDVVSAGTTAQVDGTAAGTVSAGKYLYRISFVNSDLGTESALSAVTTNDTLDKNIAAAQAGQIKLTNIPIGPKGTTARRIYRLGPNDQGQYKLAGTFQGNKATDTVTNLPYLLDDGTGQAPRTKTVPYPHWVPLTDTWDSLGITSLAFDPSDETGQTIFASTGNASSSRSSGAPIGLLKSTDGGLTWTAVGQTDLALNGLNVTAIAFSTPRVLPPSSALGANKLPSAPSTVTAAAQSAAAATITNVSLAGNVATLTTAAAHNFTAGQTVVIAGLTNAFFNGSYTLTAASGTTFSYNLTHDDVPSAPDAGTATPPAGQLQPGAYVYKVSIVNKDNGEESDLSTGINVTLGLGQNQVQLANLPTVPVGILSGVQVTNPGSGYTTAPTVTFGGTGTGAAATAILNGQVPATGVNVTNGGSGYTTAPAVTFSAAPVGGTTATGTATITNGVVTAVNITANGSGYTTPPTITFSPAPAGGTTATATVSITGGVSGVTVTAGGTGYTLPPPAPPPAVVTFSAPPTGGTMAEGTYTANWARYIYRKDPGSKAFFLVGVVNNNGDTQFTDTSPAATPAILVSTLAGTDANARGGVYRSTDGGTTWTRVSDSDPDPANAISGLPPGNVTDLKAVRDPADPTKNAILFAASAGGASFANAGIYRSTDQGLTWTKDTATVPPGLTGLPGVPSGNFDFAGAQPKRILLAVQALDKGSNSATNVYAGIISDKAAQGRFVLTEVFRTTVDPVTQALKTAWSFVVDTPGSVDKSNGALTFFGLYRPASGQGDTQGAILADPQSSYVYFSGDIQVVTGAASSVNSSNWVGRIFQLAGNQDYTAPINAAPASPNPAVPAQARGDQLVSDGAQPRPIVTDSTATDMTGGGHLSAGVYRYEITFVDDGGTESNPSAVIAVNTPVTAMADDQIKLDKLPVGPVGTVRRLIYRTRANGDSFFYVGKLDNSNANPTTYTDGEFDMNLGASLKGFAAPDVSATGANTGLIPVGTVPGEPTFVADGNPHLKPGTTYEYRVQFYRFVNGNLTFSDASDSASVPLPAGKNSLTLQNIPLGPAGTVGRVVFRRDLGGGTAAQFHLLAYINDNTQTKYLDQKADSANLYDIREPLVQGGGFTQKPAGVGTPTASMDGSITGDVVTRTVAYKYRMTLVFANGIESGPVDLGTVTPTATDNIVTITGFPALDAGVVAHKFYRQEAGSNDYNYVGFLTGAGNFVDRHIVVPNVDSSVMMFTEDSTGGGLVAGQYGYKVRFYYSFSDPNPLMRIQSSLSDEAPFTVTGSFNTIKGVIPTASDATAGNPNKRDVFRTKAAGGATVGFVTGIDGNGPSGEINFSAVTVANFTPPNDVQVASRVTARAPTGGSAPHGDSHVMLLDPSGGLIEGDDGGIYRLDRTKNGNGAWVSLIGDLGNSEVGAVAFDPINNRVLVGTQDTGGEEQTTSGATPGWTDLTGGDGNFQAVGIDGTKIYHYNLSTEFSSMQRQEFTAGGQAVGSPVYLGSTNRTAKATATVTAGALTIKVTDGGSGYTTPPAVTLAAPPGGVTPAVVGAVTLDNGRVTAVALTNPGRGYTTAPAVTIAAPPPVGLAGMTDIDRNGAGFQPYPFVVNAVDHKRLLLGWRQLYFSSDNGATVKSISTADELNSGYTTQYSNTDSGPSALSAIAYGGMNADGSPAPDVIYRARVTQIKVSEDNGAHWSAGFDLRSIGATGNVTQIALDPKNWKTAYATAGQKVFATTDGGLTWADITGPDTGTGALPSQDLTSVVLIPIDKPDMHFQLKDGEMFDVSLRGARTVGDIKKFIETAGTVVPTVTFSDPALAPNAGGVRATGTAVVDPATGKVTSVIITNPGKGYDSTAANTVMFSIAMGGLTTALGTVQIGTTGATAGQVTGVSFTGTGNTRGNYQRVAVGITSGSNITLTDKTTTGTSTFSVTVPTGVTSNALADLGLDGRTATAGVITGDALVGGFTATKMLSDLKGTATAPATGVRRSAADTTDDEDVLLVGGSKGVYRDVNPVGDPAVPGAGYAAITAPSKAVFMVPIPGANNDLTFTAGQPGDAFNDTEVQFVNRPLDPPVLNTPTAADGGSLAANTTYYWVITATTAKGETTVSDETSLAIGATPQKAHLSWTRVPNATGYNVYRSTTSGTYSATSLVQPIPSGVTLSWDDMGLAATAGTPPTSNTAISAGPATATWNPFTETLVFDVRPTTTANDVVALLNGPDVTNMTATPNAGGGTLAEGTYDYKVSFLDANGDESNLSADNQTARATATVDNTGAVTINVTDGGSGYDDAHPPMVTIAPPPGAGNPATAGTVTVVNGKVTAVAVNPGSSGYSAESPPKVTIGFATASRKVVPVDMDDSSVTLGMVPTGPAGTTARKIYRAVSGTNDFTLVGTINDNDPASSPTDYGTGPFDPAVSDPSRPDAPNVVAAQTTAKDGGSGGQLAGGTYKNLFHKSGFM